RVPFGLRATLAGGLQKQNAPVVRSDSVEGGRQPFVCSVGKRPVGCGPRAPRQLSHRRGGYHGPETGRGRSAKGARTIGTAGSASHARTVGNQPGLGSSDPPTPAGRRGAQRSARG